MSCYDSLHFSKFHEPWWRDPSGAMLVLLCGGVLGSCGDTGDHGADKSTVFSNEVGEITVLMTATRYWMFPRSHALTVREFPFITSSNPYKTPTRYVLWYPYFTNAKLKIKEVSGPRWDQDLNLSRLPPEYWIALNVPVPQKASLLFSTLLGSHWSSGPATSNASSVITGA